MNVKHTHHWTQHKIKYEIPKCISKWKKNWIKTETFFQTYSTLGHSGNADIEETCMYNMHTYILGVANTMYYEISNFKMLEIIYLEKFEVHSKIQLQYRYF